MTYNEGISLVADVINNASFETPAVIAVDGSSASGKTTFAKEIEARFGIPVIHTDDFCRPRNEKGELEISEFDGNFDLERFKAEVICGIKSLNPFDIGIFNCKIGRIDRTIEVPCAKCYLIEGAYSHNPKLGEYSTVKIFFDISFEVQKERIIARDGDNKLETYLSIWIPAEERYIQHYGIVEKSDYHINI